MSDRLSSTQPESGRTDADKAAAPKQSSHFNLLDIAEDFGKAAVFTGIQEPVTALSQLIDHCAHTNLAADTSFISAPDSKFGSAGWYSQQVGNVVGMVPWFLGIRESLAGLAGDEALAAHPVLSASTSGLLYGSLLQPAEGTGSFWDTRLKDGAITGATFGVLAGTGKLLNNVAENKLATNSFAQRIFKNQAIDGVIAGIPAGFVEAEGDSVISGNGPASGKRLFRSAYSYAMIGGVLGAIDDSGRGKTKTDTRTEDPPKAETETKIGAGAETETKSESKQVPKHEAGVMHPDGKEVVLGAGGVRGFGTIGFLRYLEDQHVKIRQETGVSIGGILATFHTNGYSSNQVEQFMKGDLGDIFNKLAEKGSIKHPLRSMSNHWFDMQGAMQQVVDKYDLKPQENLRLVAYNLLAREPVVFEGTNYNLAQALAASASVPGAMRPIYYKPPEGVELNPSMSKRGILIDGGTYRMTPTEFSSDQALIAKISEQKPFPRPTSFRDIPRKVEPMLFAMFKGRYKEPSGDHLVVHAASSDIDALDVTLSDAEQSEMIEHGYKQAHSVLSDHILNGTIPVIKEPEPETSESPEALPKAPRFNFSRIFHPFRKTAPVA